MTNEIWIMLLMIALNITTAAFLWRALTIWHQIAQHHRAELTRIFEAAEDVLDNLTERDGSVAIPDKQFIALMDAIADDSSNPSK